MKLREWDSDDWLNAFFSAMGIWFILFLFTFLIVIWKGILE